MKVLLFLTKGVEMMEASAYLDVFGWYRDLNKGEIDVVTCGFSEDIKSTFNLRFKVDVLIQDVVVEDYAALLIPGGFGTYGFYEEAYHPQFLELIQAFDKAGKILSSICVGSLPLGKSGVLSGKKGTTYHLMNGRRQQQLQEMGVEVINDPVVVDGRYITSWCPATAPEVAFRTLEKLTSKEEVAELRTMMGFD